MDGLVTLILAGVWLICGVITAGAHFAYFQREFPTLADEDRRSDALGAYFFGALGPFGLLAVVICDGFRHGWRWPTFSDD